MMKSKESFTRKVDTQLEMKTSSIKRQFQFKGKAFSGMPMSFGSVAKYCMGPFVYNF